MTFPMKALTALALALLAARPLPAAAGPRQVDERVTTASGVRVRAEPSSSGAEVGKLKLGTVVVVVDESPARETVAGVSAPWLRIAPADGLEGWIFGGFAMPFPAAQREPILRRLAADRLKLPEPSFNDMADLAAFAARVGPGMSPAGAAELELARLKALARAAAAIPFDKGAEEPFASWLKAQGESVVYSEPAGQWFVNSDLYWQAARRYATVPAGETLAWEGAQAPIPGECEGYLPCHVYMMRVSMAQYLGLYPNGPHAAEALGAIRELVDEALAPESPYRIEDQDHAELRKELDAIRVAVSRVSGPKAAALLKAVDTLSKTYR